MSNASFSYYPSQIAFFDCMDRGIGSFDAYGLDALERDGLAVLRASGSVHLTVLGRHWFFLGLYSETQDANVALFAELMARLRAYRSGNHV